MYIADVMATTVGAFYLPQNSTKKNTCPTFSSSDQGEKKKHELFTSTLHPRYYLYLSPLTKTHPHWASMSLPSLYTTGGFRPPKLAPLSLEVESFLGISMTC